MFLWFVAKCWFIIYHYFIKLARTAMTVSPMRAPSAPLELQKSPVQ